METPPRFKFKILASFQDPLTRHIAESVRIEGAGEGILNYKSEYSRCRVPRLRLDSEGWSRLQKEKAVESVVEVPEDDGEELGMLETKERRQDMKRAIEDVQEGPKPKRRGS